MKLRYTILYVNDVTSSLLFYRDALGLPVKAEHGTYVEFGTGETILAINTRADVRDITGLHVPDTTGKTFELGFVVDDVQATIARLKSLHVPIVVEPLEKPWGQTVAYVHDPDGHYVEICSSLD